MTDKTTEAQRQVSEVLARMISGKNSCHGLGPGPDQDTIAYLSLGWSDDPRSVDSSRDTKIRLVPQIRNGVAVIVVEKV